MAKKKSSKGRNCPRCNNDVSVVMRTVARDTAVAVAVCNKCGRGWGIGCIEIKGMNTAFLQKYAVQYRQKWDKYGIGDL